MERARSNSANARCAVIVLDASRVESDFNRLEGDLEAGVGGSGEAFQNRDGGAGFSTFKTDDSRNSGFHAMSQLLLGEASGFAGFDHGDSHITIGL